MICKRVQYSGRVQGVGFRYTTQSIASAYAVTGFVRNLPNGDVELVAQGSAEDVEAFLAAVARKMAGYITDARITDETPGDYKDFRIRY
ncbi:MAG: acylphosphatase [Gemmatales bacterium]|nr:MAG: acylphosphatase [Gemmatales bacterium]